MNGLCGEKTYRNRVKAEGLATFRICEKETDVFISAAESLREEALASVLHYREQIEIYMRSEKEFGTSLISVHAASDAPAIVRDMIRESRKAGVGPMASVAGAIAQYVGEDLLEKSGEVIVENGGDIFLKIMRRRLTAIYAGDSVLSGKVALEIEPEETPLGICTSSGTVGHSLSFGKADAVVVCSPSAILADAAATAACNLIKTDTDVEKALKYLGSIDGVIGAVVIFGDKLGAWGNVRIKPV